MQMANSKRKKTHLVLLPLAKLLRFHHMFFKRDRNRKESFQCGSRDSSFRSDWFFAKAEIQFLSWRNKSFV